MDNYKFPYLLEINTFYRTNWKCRNVRSRSHLSNKNNIAWEKKCKMFVIKLFQNWQYIYTGSTRIQSTQKCLNWSHEPKHNIRRYSKKKPGSKSKSYGNLKHFTRQIHIYRTYFRISCKQHHNTCRRARSRKG